MNLPKPAAVLQANYFWCVVFPLVLGFVFYLFRTSYPNTLIDFSDFFNNEKFKFLTFAFNSSFGKLLLYSIPSFLWSFSMYSFFLLRTKDDTLKVRFFYIAIVTIIAYGTEFLQLFLNFGTFDFNDLIAVQLGGFFALKNR